MSSSTPTTSSTPSNSQDQSTRHPGPGISLAPLSNQVKIEGHVFDIPADPVQSLRFIREQTIASYRAVTGGTHTPRDLAFIFGTTASVGTGCPQTPAVVGTKGTAEKTLQHTKTDPPTTVIKLEETASETETTATKQRAVSSKRASTHRSVEAVRMTAEVRDRGARENRVKYGKAPVIELGITSEDEQPIPVRRRKRRCLRYYERCGFCTQMGELCNGHECVTDKDKSTVNV